MATSKKMFFALLTLLLPTMFLHEFVEGRTTLVIGVFAERSAEKTINISIFVEKWPKWRDFVRVINGDASRLPGGPFSKNIDTLIFLLYFTSNKILYFM